MKFLKFFNPLATDFILARLKEISTVMVQFLSSAKMTITQVPLIAYSVNGNNLQNYSSVNLLHFYTITESEKNYVIATWPGTWTYEGPVFYAYPVN